jgi:membrane-associated phospholipid phosphatase
MPKIKDKTSNFIRSNLKFFLAGFFLLAAFYAFSFLVKEDFFTRFDFDMTVKVQNNIPVRFDPYFSIFSLIGSFEGTLAILVILSVIKRKIGGVFVIFMFCLMHVVELVGKAFLDHPGTPFMFHRYAFDFVFPTGYVQPGGSYPSGHAMRTAFLTVLFVFIISQTKLGIKTKLFSYAAIIAIYLVMAVSRVSLGEHWTSDVIGGSLLGVAFTILSLVLI